MSTEATGRNNDRHPESTDYVCGDAIKADPHNFSDDIAFNDHKIRFMIKYCRDKSVLDIGCVMHDPENYKSVYWQHKALKAVTSEIVGMDIYAAGVEYLKEKGFNVIVGDARAFDLARTFDVIVAGDIIEHLDDHAGFIQSCERHMHKDSRLLIATPNPWYWATIAKAILSPEPVCNPEHTCWLCPRTLRQLVNRHGMDVGEVVYASRYLRDRLLPLPRGIKHTSFNAEVFLKQAD